MRRPRSRDVGVVLGLVGAMAPAPASAYCRSTTCSGDCSFDEAGCKTSGKPLFWPTSCVGYSLQKDASENLSMAEARPAIQAAFDSWSNLPCDDAGMTLASIRFDALDDVSCREVEFAEEAGNANVVLFQDYKWNYTSTDNSLARTTVTFSAETGEILDADIEINHAFNNFTTGEDVVVTDLQTVMVHEIGHFMGLDHTPMASAVMFAETATGSLKRELGIDDVDAACGAYPPDRSALCSPLPQGGLSKTCEAEQEEAEGCSIGRGGETSSGFWLSAMALLLLHRRRRTS